MEEIKQEEVVEQEPKSMQEAFYDLPNAPSKVQIEKWKAQFGDVFVHGFTDSEFFIFRSLKRSEFKKLQLMIAESSEKAPEERIDQLQYEEMVCDTCVIFPEKKTDWDMKAGAATTLYEQIMQRSHFMNPQMAAMSVIKL